MSQSVIRCSGPFWEWVSKTRKRYEGPSRYCENSKVSLSGPEVASAIQIFTERYRYTDNVDNLECECGRVISMRKPKKGRRPIKRRMKLEQTKPGSWQHCIAMGSANDGFRFTTTAEFKHWFDETRLAFSQPDTDPLTQMEFADALMFLVKSNRYAKGDQFQRICEKVGAARDLHWRITSK